MAEDPKPSKVPPYLVAALTCDVGATDPASGKKSLIGVFNTVYVQVFPTTRPASLYIKLADGRGFYPLRIQFMRSDDERVIMDIEGEVNWIRPEQPMDLLLPVPPIPLEAQGRYEFRILMSDMYVGRAVLDVLPFPSAPPGPSQRN